MSQSDALPRSAPHAISREARDRLLRAVAELRALERERQGTRAARRNIDEVSRRIEAKAREVFRLAREDGAESERKS